MTAEEITLADVMREVRECKATLDAFMEILGQLGSMFPGMMPGAPSGLHDMAMPSMPSIEDMMNR